MSVATPWRRLTENALAGSRAATALLAIAMTLSCLAGYAKAQSYPTKPVRFVLIVAAGGGLDATARLIANKLGPRLGQQVIVENRPGAGGNVASEYVARQPADGYTLLLTANGHTLNPLIYATPGYDPFKDFLPVVELTEGPVILVTQPSAPYKSLKDVVEGSRTKSLSYAHGGLGMPPHIAMEMFKQAAGAQIASVPYKGAGPALQDALGGHIPLAILSLAGATPSITAGQLHPLALSGAKRWPTLPNVPTFAESGYPEAIYLNWQGVMAPTGTPPEIIARLHKEIAAVMAEPDVKDALSKIGAEPTPKGPAEFAEMLKADFIANKKVVDKLQLKVE